MFMAMAKDIRVIIIKLADRLHNMRTLASLPPAKQQAIARETLDIYAPIAHRLGIWKIKWEIEDECLRYLDPGRYHDIVERVAKTRREREADVEKSIARLRDEFEELKVNAEIQGRPKHFYSIYSKIRKGRDFSTIYDLTAIRIIVDSVKDCYAALGRGARDVDAAAGPLQRLHRDAQAQHVPVAAHDGRRPERRSARNSDPHVGDASHERVRHRRALALQRRRQGRPVREQTLLAARAARVAEGHARLAHVHGEPQARSVRLAGLRLLAARRRVLAAGRRDAARFRVSGAHRRRQPLRRREDQRPDRAARLQLQNGDICEILVNKSSGRPSLDWLSIVKTSSAKHKIKQWFRKERSEENVLAGQEALEQELARAGLRTDLARGELIERIARA